MTTTVLRPNRDTLNRALDIYIDAMRPYLTRCLRRTLGVNVEDAIRRALPSYPAARFAEDISAGKTVEESIEPSGFPRIISEYWRDTFANDLSLYKGFQANLWRIKEGRDKAAHPSGSDLQTKEAISFVELIAEALGAIGATMQRDEALAIRDSLLPTPAPVAEPTQSVDDADSTDQAKKRPASSAIKPWSDVITPKSDVLQGSVNQSEFAADLYQVHTGQASGFYSNPVEFYESTYVTRGLRALLVNAMSRLAGRGGHPVVQTKTGFGGGKTHSLIALYHLAKNSDALLNAGANSAASQDVREIVKAAGLDPDDDGDLRALHSARVAVLDGSSVAPTDTDVTENGDPLNTLWGRMAHQLGGQDAYELIGAAARAGTAPGGGQLDRLLASVGPCVILIDELVSYVRNAGDMEDNVYTFIQNLTQAVRRSENAMLVVTLPEHESEAGGERGMKALDTLASILGRIEAIWEPLEVTEAFEVVRRRLFDAEFDDAERDNTCDAFHRMYSQSRREYPREVAEARYAERMRDCYPIHPEIFDRLYNDWSSDPRFQRTRGVLRTMAACINRLFLDSSDSPLIMPGDLRWEDTEFSGEFIRLLGENWRPVISEVDGVNSRPDMIDSESTRYGELGGVAKRTTRAILFGSKPNRAQRGIDEKQIHLSVVCPGQGVATYNEARNKLVTQLYYLYHADGKFYFHTDQNLNKVAEDRAAALSEDQIDKRIVDFLEEAKSSRGLSSDVIDCPSSSADVPDADSVRLVILRPAGSLNSRKSDSDDATQAALDILNNRGEGFPRENKNMLLFLTAKKDEIRELRNSARKFLAWNSIINGENRVPNMSMGRQTLARDNLKDADRKINADLVRAYRWALAPRQGDPKDAATITLTLMNTGVGQDGEIVTSAFDKLKQEEAMATEIAPSQLANTLKTRIWSNPAYEEHIGVNALWGIFTQYVYMPRLKDKVVLIKAIRAGVGEGAVGVASAYVNGSYDKFQFLDFKAEQASSISEFVDFLIINPVLAGMIRDDAIRQRSQSPDDIVVVPPGPADPDVDDPAPPVFPTPPLQPAKRTITVTKTFKDDLSLDAVGDLKNEIIDNLIRDGADVNVQIIITASNPDGFKESTARAVRENSEQLKLEFEEV